MATTVVKQGSVPAERPIGWALMGLAALALAAVTRRSRGPEAPAPCAPLSR